MTPKSKKLLNRLLSACDVLGGSLDGTATSGAKLLDRQRAHRDISKVLYGVLCDSPKNDQREYDLEVAEEHMQAIEAIANKKYADKNGN